MDDKALADEIILRLNKLIEDDAVRKTVEKLCIHGRVKIEEEFAGSLADHPTIQLSVNTFKTDPITLGFLGMLNGIIGSSSDEEFYHCGYIAAIYDKPEEASPSEDWMLSKFDRFDKDAV